MRVPREEPFGAGVNATAPCGARGVWGTAGIGEVGAGVKVAGIALVGAGVTTEAGAF